jgi:hypothetical protein
MTVALMGSLAVLGRLVTSKTLAFQLTSLEKRILAILGLSALTLNWAWLIYSHP